jgi:hypothetical protein
MQPKYMTESRGIAVYSYIPELANNIIFPMTCL